MVVEEKKANVKERNLPDTVKVVSREDWKARRVDGEMLPLKKPLHNIILTWTDTEPCQLPEECEQRVRDVQKEHMKQGLPDIQYNFLVGGDKLIYEGRGFNHEPPRYPEDKIENAYVFNGKCIEIAFIDKHMAQPQVDMINKVADFLAVQMIKKIVLAPVGMKGIKDNQIVRFSELMDVHYQGYSDKVSAYRTEKLI